MVLKYLRYTLDYELCYIGYLAVLKRYNDANWIFDTDDLKSIGEYIFTLGGIVISCKSSKKTCITRTTLESKFIALDKVG
jgi:hypothetical protein